MRKQNKHEKKEISLPLDSRNRICLSRFLTQGLEISSFKAYMEGEKIILEPMEEVPACEAWLYKNPKALSSVLKGLKQADDGLISKLETDLTQFLENENEDEEI